MNVDALPPSGSGAGPSALGIVAQDQQQQQQLHQQQGQQEARLVHNVDLSGLRTAFAAGPGGGTAALAGPWQQQQQQQQEAEEQQQQQQQQEVGHVHMAGSPVLGTAFGAGPVGDTATPAGPEERPGPEAEQQQQLIPQETRLAMRVSG